MVLLTPDIHELRGQPDLVRDHRDRLFGELRHIGAREQTEGAYEGLAERRANLNTGVEKLDKQFDELREQITAAMDKAPSEPGFEPPGPRRRARCTTATRCTSSSMTRRSAPWRFLTSRPRLKTRSRTC
jgi:hypothetical protein